MARIVHKDGATSCSFGGSSYVADADGVFDVPDEAVPPLFASHGFMPPPAAGAPDEAVPAPAPQPQPETPRRGRR